MLTMLLAAGVLTLLAACDERVVYHTYRTLPLSGWSGTDTLLLPALSLDAAMTYQVSVTVRNHSTYPYRNLPLLICCTDSLGQRVYADTLQVQLADADGNWQGNGLGGLYEQTTAAGTLYAPHGGSYLFTINHLLPDAPLSGINDVGIKVSQKE